MAGGLSGLVRGWLVVGWRHFRVGWWLDVFGGWLVGWLVGGWRHLGVGWWSTGL